MAATAAGVFPSLHAAGTAMSRVVWPPAYLPTACPRTRALLAGKRAVYKTMQQHQREYRAVMEAATSGVVGH